MPPVEVPVSSYSYIRSSVCDVAGDLGQLGQVKQVGKIIE